MDINAEEEDEPAPEPYGKGTEFVATKWSDEKDEKGDSKGYIKVQGTIVENAAMGFTPDGLTLPAQADRLIASILGS